MIIGPPCPIATLCWKSKNTYIPNFWIYDAFLTNNFSFGGLPKTNVIFCKTGLSKMASVKTNKNKNRTRLLKTSFSWIETLSLGPKRFLHSKGPKNVICLWLRLWKSSENEQCSVKESFWSKKQCWKLWKVDIKKWHPVFFCLFKQMPFS